MTRTPRVQDRRQRHRPGQQGYSLVELIIGLTVAIIVLLVLFQTFQRNTQLARTQIDVADMQQAQRVVQQEMSRMIRMTGRGGLQHMVDRGNGTRFLPALTVRDNVPANQRIAIGNGSAPLVAEGTDVLTIRGVFNSPVYQLNFADPGTLVLKDASGGVVTDTGLATQGTLTVTDPSPTGVQQNLQPLIDAIDDDAHEPIVLVSPIDETIYGVAEITRGSDGPGIVTIDFAITGGTHTDAYRTLYNSGLGSDPVFPTSLTNAAYVGIVEEYRFYVREPDPNTIQAPALSIARMLPGTEIAHLDDSNLQLDLADNVLDLQIALGYHSSLGDALADRNADGFVNDDDILITESDDGQNDDWLFNSDQDDPNGSPFVPPWDDDPLTAAPEQPKIYYVRLTTLARVQVPDRTYDAMQISRVENRDVDPFNALDERRFRRQLLETTIDLRNL